MKRSYSNHRIICSFSIPFLFLRIKKKKGIIIKLKIWLSHYNLTALKAKKVGEKIKNEQNLFSIYIYIFFKFIPSYIVSIYLLTLSPTVIERCVLRVIVEFLWVWKVFHQFTLHQHLLQLFGQFFAMYFTQLWRQYPSLFQREQLLFLSLQSKTLKTFRLSLHFIFIQNVTYSPSGGKMVDCILLIIIWRYLMTKFYSRLGVFGLKSAWEYIIGHCTFAEFGFLFIIEDNKICQYYSSPAPRNSFSVFDTLWYN